MLHGFGSIAVAIMVLSYWLEPRSMWCVLVLAGGSAATSTARVDCVATYALPGVLDGRGLGAETHCPCGYMIGGSARATHPPRDGGDVDDGASSRMSPMAPLAPALAKRLASSAPIPLAPPLIRGPLPASRMGVGPPAGH